MDVYNSAHVQLSANKEIKLIKLNNVTNKPKVKPLRIHLFEKGNKKK